MQLVVARVALQVIGIFATGEVVLAVVPLELVIALTAVKGVATPGTRL